MCIIKKTDKVDVIKTDIKNLIPIKQLDETLRFLIDAKNPHALYVEKIKSGIGFQVEYEELEEILDKLEDDGYVKRVTTGSFSARIYQSTFSGRFFMAEQDGYMQKIQDDYAERKRLEFEYLQNLTNQRWLKYGAIATAVGTCGLLLWEIGKEIYHHCVQ